MDNYRREHVRNQLYRRHGAVTMDDAFQILEERMPMGIRIRLIVAQGYPISWFREQLFKIGVWFLKKSGTHVGENKEDRQ